MTDAERIAELEAERTRLMDALIAEQRRRMIVHVALDDLHKRLKAAIAVSTRALEAPELADE